jgi:hypothetical protein
MERKLFSMRSGLHSVSRKTAQRGIPRYSRKKGLGNVTSLMTRQFVATYEIFGTGISALLDSWVTNTHSVKYSVQNEIFGPYILVKKHNTLNFWSAENQSRFSCLL